MKNKVYNHFVNHDFASSVKDNNLNEFIHQYQHLLDYKEPDIVINNNINIESINKESESNFLYNDININEMIAKLDPTLAKDIEDLKPSQRLFFDEFKKRADLIYQGVKPAIEIQRNQIFKILEGKAGIGKTHLIKIIIRYYECRNKVFCKDNLPVTSVSAFMTNAALLYNNGSTIHKTYGIYSSKEDEYMFIQESTDTNRFKK